MKLLLLLTSRLDFATQHAMLLLLTHWVHVLAGSGV